MAENDQKAKPPAGMFRRRRCPNCGEFLDVDWVWAGEFDETIYRDEDDYQAWFFVCENCQENFEVRGGKLTMIE